jgi:hypothetical protein
MLFFCFKTSGIKIAAITIRIDLHNEKPLPMPTEIKLPNSGKSGYYHKYFDILTLDDKRIAVTVYKVLLNIGWGKGKEIDCKLFRNDKKEWVNVSPELDQSLCEEIRKEIDKIENQNSIFAKVQ